MHLQNVYVIAPVTEQEIPETMHRLMKFCLMVVGSVVQNMLDSSGNLSEQKLEENHWRIQRHHHAGTAEDSSSMYHGL